MEEGEIEWEDMEDEEEVDFPLEEYKKVIVSGDEEGSDPPALVSITEAEKIAAAAATKSKKEAKVEAESSSDVSDSDDESLIDSDMDTEELEEREAELEAQQRNPDNFVYAQDLNTYRLNKQEKVEAKEKEKEATGKKVFLSNAAKRREKKNSGSTNTEKLFNKPMNMLLPKKVQTRNDKRDGKMRMIRKSEMKQLGHFNKNQ